MPRTLRIGSWNYTLPEWAPARILIGVLLILLGFLGFLPVLGFWMIPLGIVVLSHDIPRVRLLRQKITAWWRSRRRGGP